MGLDVTGIGSVADLANTVINKIWPDKSEQEKQQLAAAIMVVQGQLEINKAEAANPSVFVSGWRPFIGWCCGAACTWNWVGLPIAKFVMAMAGHPINISPADLSEMMPILLGMLGLGGLRTYEKISGVAAK
jgi:Holin of 3TMs, for gene-transfer release